ncbi:hypothetical protein [Leeia oryzae]|uniref:hypothetical protein n=1 Tax=Leeia oryzae TaxID=356662 RepID=UPI00037FF56C|nr:hypothetical protein [Leeia oryzae]
MSAHTSQHSISQACRFSGIYQSIRRLQQDKTCWLMVGNSQPNLARLASRFQTKRTVKLQELRFVQPSTAQLTVHADAQFDHIILDGRNSAITESLLSEAVRVAKEGIILF